MAAQNTEQRPTKERPTKERATTGRPRSRRPRTDRLTTIWMLLALAAAVTAIATRDALPQTWWTTIHLVTLGVLTNAILQWSWYFARGLLRLPPNDQRSGRDALIRSLAFNASLVALIAGMWIGTPALVIAFAAALGAVVAWHGLAILLAAKHALGGRHAPLLRFYVAASAMFVIGCTIAGFLTVALLDPSAPAWLLDARDGLTLAHSITMVGGWLGLTIAGTLVTLGPTVLRTRMEGDASATAVRGLPWLAAAVAGAGTTAALGWMPATGALLAAYAVGLGVWIGLPLARVMIAKGPREHAAWTLVGGIAWTGAGLLIIAALIARAEDPTSARDAVMAWIPVIGVAGPAQIFVGALTYLLPVVVGGGAATVRVGIAALETASTARLTVRTVSIALLVATTGIGADARWAWWAAVAATFAADIVLMAVAGARQAKARRAAGGAVPLAAPIVVAPGGSAPQSPETNPRSLL
ncbi:hypothetical protein LGT39_02330 [Demequina sp. TTPB684]|uniref:hypothetical protein n=1 Tax=unclassified Demequina TaxID=2620311 RepID=UPI001CF26841|nr:MULTISPECIES: hypothetical protein [unclassified Demequina]MCB2411684.1 hypothetical protein [Demequina sp. TTPB684]UPU88919.1 hypothetical protein LGT36_003085 [Demequina sp. TMPB413]